MNAEGLKISVIVPVYNTADYLNETLESLRMQTLESAEFILVDDGSTDESPAIMAAYAGKDGRFRVLTQEVNGERHMARKAGAAAAKGQYILFMDSDDTLAGSDALATLLGDMQAQQADILQFGMKVMSEAQVHQASAQWLAEHGKPYPARVEGGARELLEMAFAERRWTYNIWGKVFRAEVVKKAFDASADARLSSAEDMYEYFLITYFSRSYAGIENRDYYVYHFGRGSSGQREVSLAQFEKLCRRHDVVMLLRDFLEERQALADYEDMLRQMDQRYLDSMVLIWKNRVHAKEREAAFSLLCNTWTCERTALQFEEVFGKVWKRYDDRAEVSEKIAGRSFLLGIKDALYDFAAVRHEGVHREYAVFKRQSEYIQNRLLRWKTLIRLNLHYRLLGKKTYRFLHPEWKKAYTPQYRAARMLEKHSFRGALRGERVIVSLTTYTARINTVMPAIYSLIDQDRRPEKILLWLSRDQFPRGDSDLPEELVLVQKRCPFFEIRWVPGDLKPHKKYFYVMQEYPDIPVITVDDDAIYQKDTVRILMDSYRRHPHCVSAMWALGMRFEKDGSLSPYMTWERDCGDLRGIPSNRLLPVGVSGVLYPPHALPACAFDRQAIVRCAEVTDDLWLKVFASHQGYPVVVPKEKFNKQTVKGTQGCALYFTNDFDGNNDASLKKILSHYDEQIGSSEQLLRLWNE